MYFDYAATTPLHPKALEAMMPFLTDNFANPSSMYSPARAARKAIDEARQAVAEVLGATPAEVFFTSSGTEADNWAIKGVLKKSDHIITSEAEHPAVLQTIRYMEKLGHPVTYLPVDGEGFVCPKSVQEAIRPDTALVSIMLANNEVGTIQPLAAIGEIVRESGAIFHTDAVQAVGHIPVDVNELKVDMLTISAHKFGGPKGIAAQYIRKGIAVQPLLHGGAQEKGRRASTENVPAIVGMAAALKAAIEEMPTELPRISALRDKLTNEILATIPYTHLNGPRENRLPGNINISFKYIEGESVLLHLDMLGCQASTGSACSSGSLEPSHVLTAMGVSHELANGAIRFSLGRGTTEDDIDKLMGILTTSVTRLRELSPLYDDFLKGRGD